MNVKSDEERKSKLLKVRLNDKEFAPDKARLKEISDRINSIAIQVNQTGNIYPEEKCTEQNAYITAPCTRIITITPQSWTPKTE